MKSLDYLIATKKLSLANCLLQPLSDRIRFFKYHKKYFCNCEFMSTELKSTEDLQHEISRLKNRIAKLEKAEKQSGKTLKKIFHVAPAGIGMLCDRIFVETNPLVSDITGYSHDELIGKSSRILYQNDAEYNHVGIEKYKQIEEFGTGTLETIWKRKNGELVDILLSSTPLDQTDLQKGVIFTALDITERKLVKDNIQSSEERLKIIFEYAPDAIFLCDLKGNIVDGNLAAEKLVDQKKEELIGKSLLKLPLIRKRDFGRVTKVLAQNALGIKTGPDNFKIKAITGKMTEVEVTTYLIRINKQSLVLGIARDLTDRMRAEELKKENEQRLAFHFNQTPLAAIEWDLDFKVKRWNSSAERIFGFTKEEAIGQHASLIIPETAMNSVDQAWMEATSRQGTGRNTNENYCKNGDIISCEWHNTPLINEEGEVIAVASFALDVTERIRSAEIQKVVYNISNAANTTDNLNKLISQIQGELGSIIDTTNFFIALYDKETDSLSLPFFADEKDQFTTFPAGKSLTAHVIRNKKPLLANKQTIKELEAKGEIEEIGSNSEVWLGVPLAIEGEVIGVLAVQSYTNPNAYSEADKKMLKFVSDQISLSIHRKNSELKITQALEKATESDRLKSAFLANMSHEIRTPMNGILGFANLLKNEDITDKDRLQYISIIEKSGKRMLGIINDLIDISKIESGMTELIISDFNLNNSLEYVFSFFKPEAEAKGIELSYTTGLKIKDALIKSDREKVYAILINLVKNAIKYTNSGQIKFAYELKADTINFTVEDTGIGIPKDKLNSIFNRFVQADSKLSNSYEGVGLGLAITKAYIELLDGKIAVESENQKGSKFCFEIPYIAGEKLQKPEKTEKTMTDNKPKTKLNILVAEDDIINRKLFPYLLKDIAKELIMTTNGAEAVDKFNKTTNIDLILMDLKMPEMDGYEATSQIRSSNKDIKIIALSAFALETERKKALENGFNDYVSKPISKVELFKAIAQYFDI